MLLISFSSVKRLVWFFLKIKIPISPLGRVMRCFCSAKYPKRLRKFLLAANLAIFLGTIKEIRGGSLLLVKINLKVKLGELKNLPCFSTFSTVFVSALFFFASIIVPQARIRQKASFGLFGAFAEELWNRFWSWIWLKTRGLWLFFFFWADMWMTYIGVYNIIHRLSTGLLILKRCYLIYK